MNALAVGLMLLLGGALQAILPAYARLGGAVWPVLPGLAVYYALTRARPAALAAACAAGVVQDALGLVPLGYSSAAFCLVAWVVHGQREHVFPRSFGTRAVFGAAAAGGVALVQAALLAAGERRWPGAGLVARKALGALLLGAVITPWVCATADRLDAALGLAPAGGRP